MAATTSWADATNTGVPPGVTLTPSGGLIITQPGTVISGLDIQGTVYIEASNVTLQNCKITAASWSVVTIADGVTGAVVQNCEINGTGTNNDGSCGISGHGTFIGNNIYNVENGFSIAGNNSIIENNYIHNLQASGSPHYDGIQIDGNVSGVTISHNTIINDHNQTSAIMIDNGFGPISNITVDNNLLAGGGYTVYSDGQFSGGSITGVSFTNNHMEAGSFGITNFDSNNPIYTGNVNDGATLIGTLNTSANTGSTTTTTGGTTAPTGTTTDTGGTTTAGGTTTDTGGTTAGSTDSTAPATPVLASDTIVNTNHVQLTGTADANTTITVYDGNTVVGTGTTDASGTWNVTTGALSDGAHGLTATATDAAGHVSAMSGPLDPVIAATAPNTGSQQPDAPTITSLSNDSGTTGNHVTSDNAPNLSGTAAADSTVDVFDGSQKIASTTADSNGQWSVTTSELTDGGHHLTATDTDASGHTSAPSTDFSITVGANTAGTQAPDAPTVADAPTLTAYSHDGAEIGSTTSSHDIVLKGTAEANSNISVFDGEKAIGTATADDNGNWSFDANHLANGSHSFSSTATDAAGNTSAASEPDAVTVTQPVEFTNLSESSHIATIKGTADANSQIQLYEGSTSLGTVTAAADGTWSFKTGYMSNHVHTFTAQEVDSSGQTIAQSSGEAILGSSRSNTLTSTSGDDYLFGNGHPDTFVFAANFGHDVIKDFVAGGRGHDTIQFSTSEFDSFASVLSHASQAGHDVVIASGNDTLTLKNTSLTSLNSHDFHFA